MLYRVVTHTTTVTLLQYVFWSSVMQATSPGLWVIRAYLAEKPDNNGAGDRRLVVSRMSSSSSFIFFENKVHRPIGPYEIFISVCLRLWNTY